MRVLLTMLVRLCYSWSTHAVGWRMRSSAVCWKSRQLLFIFSVNLQRTCWTHACRPWLKHCGAGFWPSFPPNISVVAKQWAWFLQTWTYKPPPPEGTSVFSQLIVAYPREQKKKSVLNISFGSFCGQRTLFSHSESIVEKNGARNWSCNLNGETGS